jgi:hypothetical protein
LRRDAERRAKIAEYLVDYYENIAPFLIDLKEEVDIATVYGKVTLKIPAGLESGQKLVIKRNNKKEQENRAGSYGICRAFD